MNVTLADATASEVKRANRRLYDQVAGDYEALDGRRGTELFQWIRSRLSNLAAEHGGGLLLDLGSGSGVVTRAAEGLFERTVATDLSPRILSSAGRIADVRLAADTDALPIAGESVNVVTCFAVLHHLYDTEALAREVARVLRPGGAFWSDHDLDSAFHRRFRWPLAAYRRFRGADREYIRAGVDADTYALAEFREKGVDAALVVEQLRRVGLGAAVRFHWFGLAPLTDRLFGRREFTRGWAPLIRIVARKADGGGGR